MHLAGHAAGRVALTDIHDAFRENAVEGLEPGDFVRCRVLGPAAARADRKIGSERTGGSLWGRSTGNRPYSSLEHASC